MQHLAAGPVDLEGLVIDIRKSRSAPPYRTGLSGSIPKADFSSVAAHIQTSISGYAVTSVRALSYGSVREELAAGVVQRKPTTEVESNQYSSLLERQDLQAYGVISFPPRTSHGRGV